MRKLASIVALALVCVALPSRAVIVLATPSNELTNFFATPYSVTTAGGPLYLLSADTVPHSVLSEAKRADHSASWCAQYDLGQCPLFWSAEITQGIVAVQGLSVVKSGTQYPFYCGVHHWMKGTLVVL